MPAAATAAAVVDRLARLEVADLDPALTALLAPAAAELAAAAGLRWRDGGDDPPVALVRLIARAAAAAPAAGGPSTDRLLARLDG